MLSVMGFLVLLYGLPTHQSESEFHGEHRNDRLGRRLAARKDDIERKVPWATS